LLIEKEKGLPGRLPAGPFYTLGDYPAHPKGAPTPSSADLHTGPYDQGQKGDAGQAGPFFIMTREKMFLHKKCKTLLQ